MRAPLSSSSSNDPSFSAVMTRRTDSSALSCTWPMYASTVSRPYWATIARSSCTPFSLAAICARRSAIVCSGLRAGCAVVASCARSASSRNAPSRTSRKLSNSTPSSSIVFENGGIEPGVRPPMSAW